MVSEHRHPAYSMVCIYTRKKDTNHHAYEFRSCLQDTVQSTMQLLFLHDFFLHPTTSASTAASSHSRPYANISLAERLRIGSYHLFPVGVLPNVFKVVEPRLENVFVSLHTMRFEPIACSTPLGPLLVI